MTVDSTLTFAQRRNVPVRYNRELVAKTLQAMERINEIRAKREKRFYQQRMKGQKQKDLEEDRKLVAENQHLLPPQYRDQVQVALEETDMVETADMELDPMEQKQKGAMKVKRKQKLLRDGSVEEEEDMEVDR